LTSKRKWRRTKNATWICKWRRKSSSRSSKRTWARFTRLTRQKLKKCSETINLKKTSSSRPKSHFHLI